MTMSIPQSFDKSMKFTIQIATFKFKPYDYLEFTGIKSDLKHKYMIYKNGQEVV